MAGRVPDGAVTSGAARAGSSGRPLVPYAGLLATTIVLGLATRRFPSSFPTFIARYGGDALWAAMVFWLVALIRRRAGTRALALAALGIACIVESSQAYHAPWIDAVRATRGGALLLGQGFLWSDLACYAVGVAAAAALDLVFTRRGRA